MTDSLEWGTVARWNTTAKFSKGGVWNGEIHISLPGLGGLLFSTHFLLLFNFLSCSSYFSFMLFPFSIPDEKIVLVFSYPELRANINKSLTIEFDLEFQRVAKTESHFKDYFSLSLSICIIFEKKNYSLINKFGLQCIEPFFCNVLLRRSFSSYRS